MAEINIRKQVQQQPREHKTAAKQFTTTEDIQAQLFADLKFLAQENNYQLFYNAFLSQLERNLAQHRDKIYYGKDKNAIQVLYKNGIDKLMDSKGSNQFKEIMKRYASSPFGIFDHIFSKDFPASDIFITDRKISFSITNAQKGSTEIEIPPVLIPIYHMMVEKLISFSLYASTLENTKFDRSNAILDYSLDEIRFNVVEKSLNANNDSPIVACRKQIISNKLLDSSYINSLGLSQSQIEFVNELAYDKSFIIFGETGSGKTTMLKYMGAYRLPEKRNVITIEDTPELGLPINISYLTNDNYNIQSLFRITLRENPSHVIIGETRSEEIIDILESGLVFRVSTTLHADSLSKVIMRIAFMSKKAKSEYSTDELFRLINSVVDGFIYMKNRKVIEIWRRKPDANVASDNVFDSYELVH